MQIEENLEFYCYLKKELPVNYQIISIPLTAYYSEWLFEYHLFKEGKLIRKYKGDFRAIEKGELVSEAKRLMLEILKGGD